MAGYTKVLMPACTFIECGAAIHWEQHSFWSSRKEEPAIPPPHRCWVELPVTDGASPGCECVVQGIGDLLPRGRQPGLATMGRWCRKPLKCQGTFRSPCD